MSMDGNGGVLLMNTRKSSDMLAMALFVALFSLAAGLAKAEDAPLPGEKEYNAGAEKAKAEYDAKLKALKDAFVSKLKAEMTTRTKAGDLDGAIKAKNKISLLESESSKPASADDLPTDKATGLRFTYTYKKSNVSKSYPDQKCEKLRDGKFESVWNNETGVGWSKVKPCPIVICLDRPTAIKSVDVCVFGSGSGGGVNAPSDMTVSAGTADAPITQIGKAQDIEDKTAWVSIKVDKNVLDKSVQYLWLDISAPRVEFVMIQEIRIIPNN